MLITVRSGDGGHGAVLRMPTQSAVAKSHGKLAKENPWKKSSFKRDFDGSLILPMGGHGGDVVIYADEGKDTLLEFHNKRRYNAKRGGNVDSVGVLSSQLRGGLAAPTLRIPVPLGLYGSWLLSYKAPDLEILLPVLDNMHEWIWRVSMFLFLCIYFSPCIFM